MAFNQTYSTVSDEIVKIRARLHDSGVLWKDAELLNYYQDGYRKILAHTDCTKRFFIQEVPGRTAFAYCYPWEYEHCTRGTKQQFTKTNASGFYQHTYRWEAEQVEGIPVEASNICVTQLWELTMPSGSVVTDQHYEFFLPNTERHRIERVAYDNYRLDVTSTEELDLQRNAWFRQGGQPFWWLEGLGPDTSFEIYSIKTNYNQEWEHNLNITDTPTPQGANANAYGNSRAFSSDANRSYAVAVVAKYQPAQNFAYTNSGEADALNTQQTQVATSGTDSTTGDAGVLIKDGLGIRITGTRTLASDMFPMYNWERQLVDDINNATTTSPSTELTIATYPWEVDAGFLTAKSLDAGLGIVRYISSPDRQFLPTTADSGMFNHLGILRDIKSSSNSITVWQSVVPGRAIQLDDAPSLLPPQMRKYLRYYVLGMALARSGEGQRADLARLYMALYEEGVQFMQVLTNLSFKERNYARETYAGERIPRWPRVQFPPQFPPFTAAY